MVSNWLAKGVRSAVTAGAVLVLIVGMGYAGENDADLRKTAAEQSKIIHDLQQRLAVAAASQHASAAAQPGSAATYPEPFYAGSFLVARPDLQNTHFARAVILLLKHDADGSCGLVVNQPGIAQDASFPVFLGGPCPVQGLVMLHGHAEWQARVPEKPTPPVAPGIFLGDEASLKLATETPNARFRVFTGCTGWGPGQLKREVDAGAWALVPASGPLLFDTDVHGLWESLAQPRTQPGVN